MRSIQPVLLVESHASLVARVPQPQQKAAPPAPVKRVISVITADLPATLARRAFGRQRVKALVSHVWDLPLV